MPWRILVLVVAGALVACSGPSVTELDERLDAFPVPETWELVDTTRFEAGEDCKPSLDPECPRVRRWYRTTDSYDGVRDQMLQAIEDAEFTIEREPIPCPDDGSRQCSLSAMHEGLRLWVFYGQQREGAPQATDGETIVELQLSAS